MDVGSWLRSLGLGQYEAAFRDNSIDADVLPDLSDGDLAQLGVNLGDRKRLLKAIASLGATSPVTKPTRSPPLSLSTDGAERRPITVMFCDLVDSTGLAAKLDAEDWRTLVNTYLDEASAAVMGFGGHVLKKLGDGLMALFGYPHAQENDPERGVRAALAIQRALVEINGRNTNKGAPELQARIGLDSGQVVVDAMGEVFGDAPNIAARVQGAAEPGSILITAAVQRQTAGLFVAEDRGQHELKGVSAPMTLYRVVRASGGGRRGGARVLTPLVGREDELALLTRRWSRALEGEGQFVQIVGEPGIGKSRLIEEFRAKLSEMPHTWVELAASQLLQNTPLHPLAEWGRLRFGGADATDEGRLADLENTLRLVGLDVGEYAPLIAPLVDIPLPTERVPKFAPEELRRRQLAAVTAWFLAGARTQPVVLAFEDLHWADPTSLDLIQSLAERGAQAPLLVVATTRPEFRAPWGMRSHHAVVALAPLDRTGVRRMVGDIAAQHALPQEVVERVSERTGGVPLFVEEVTRLLVERGDTGSQGVPPTLQQSLAARLDRLGEAREVAQIGAVLGRDFAYELLRDVAGLDESALQRALERLTKVDLLFVEGAPPQANYRFKHALIQDAAYDSLLKSRRQALHRRAADALRDANAEPEAIAHHFAQGGLDDLAIEWWGKAGDQALRRSAFQEAIAHLGNAIKMSEAGAGATEKPGAKLKLQVSYGNALMAARGYTSPETRVAFERAREGWTGVEGVSERLSVYYGLWIVSHVRGELGAARELADAFFHDHKKSPDPGAASVANRLLGATKWFAGEFVAARAHLEKAVSIFDPERGTDLTVRFGHDIGISAIGYSAFALWPLGEIDLALRRVAQLAARADKPGHALSAGVGYGLCALFAMLGRDAARAKPFILSTSKIGDDREMALIKAISMSLDGWVAWRSGQVDASLLGLRQGIAGLRQQGVVLWSPLLETVLAEAEAEVGEIEAAVATIDHVLVESKRTGQRWHDAESHRIRGEILLRRNPADPAPAEEALLTAIASRSRKRGASNCARRSRSPSSTSRPAASLTPTPSSRPRSKALRRRRKLRRSPRRMR